METKQMFFSVLVFLSFTNFEKMNNMKQVVLNVDEKKYKFFMELIKNFNFITVSNEETAKKQTLKEIAQGMQAAILADKGKIKTRSAKVFLNEL
jgi:hypothetical protein